VEIIRNNNNCAENFVAGYFVRETAGTQQPKTIPSNGKCHRGLRHAVKT
jgi:hypothetical protein